MAKYMFACFIPFLHIQFENCAGIYFIRQYISRLGVPFFFAVSGIMLACSIQKRGRIKAGQRYTKRIAMMLLLWLLIYSPILMVSMRDDLNPFQTLLFNTPAYLWYLTALLFATIPFCLIKKRIILCYLCIPLYLWGTLIGGNYAWLTGGCEFYTKTFLTTRNGIFFALPMMCIGELAINKPFLKRWCLPGFLLSLSVLYLEVTLTGNAVTANLDRSMYITLPFAVYFLVLILVDIRIPFSTNFLRGASSAIYLMQFGIISIMTKLFSMFGLKMSMGAWLIYFTLILIPCMFYSITKGNKYLKLLF